MVIAMANYLEPQEPSYDEKRRAFKQARIAEEKAGGIEARLWANLSAWKKGESAWLVKAFTSLRAGIIKAVGEKVKAELAGIKTRQAKAADDLKAELFDRVEAEIAAAVRDLRETNGETTKQAERLANRAAERAVIGLSAEVEELRREIQELRASR
jgi:hypothetical protein